MSIPKTIVISPLTYVVEQVTDLYHKGTPVFGVFDPSKLIIQIEQNMPEQRKPITLWHEVLHAILNHVERKDVDEDIMTILAFGIVGVLQTNPTLRNTHITDAAREE